MSDQNSIEKLNAGCAAAEYVRDGMLVGLGTGSTVRFTIERLGEMIREGLQIKGVATSVQTEDLAAKCGIELLDIDAVERLDLCIDGADEIDADLNLIKGGGGALFREKMVAEKAAQMIVVADGGKVSDKLGSFPLPVEVVRFGHETTAQKLRAEANVEPQLRMKVKGQEPFISDNGNFIYDLKFDVIDDPKSLHDKLKAITGAVETGLFINIAKLAIIGNGNAVREIAASTT